MSAYFQPAESEDVQAGQLAWWCDALQDWAREQVVWALRRWNADNPERRPTPGHIVQMLKAARAKAEIARMRNNAEPQDEPKRRVDPDRANAILREAGFPPYSVKSFPKEGEE